LKTAVESERLNKKKKYIEFEGKELEIVLEEYY